MDSDSETQSERHRAVIRQRIVHYTALLISLIICATAALLESTKISKKEPEPYHTSALTGEGWVIELLVGHPERIRCELGMHAHVFSELISELRALGHCNSKFVSLEEQLAIFLYSSVTGLTIRHVGERFQRSNETISRYFRKMLTIFSSPPFYSRFVHMPATDQIHTKIRTNPRFWPYFKGAVGAIDGSHISAAPPARSRAAFRNRKGFISQNCLFACDFDMLFTYALTGWEGSATDARIYQDARSRDLHVPDGRYFLGDAGFPLRPEILIPYQGVRYHLAEWRRAQLRPANKEELFNLRHASARNVIERIFGVLKCRFRVLLLSPEYHMDIQARIPTALCAIHNFIRIHDTEEVLDDERVHEFENDIEAHSSSGPQEDLEDGRVDEDNGTHAARSFRNQTAQAMWDEYQRILSGGDYVDDGEIFSDDEMDNKSEGRSLEDSVDTE